MTFQIDAETKSIVKRSIDLIENGDFDNLYLEADLTQRTRLWRVSNLTAGNNAKVIVV